MIITINEKMPSVNHIYSQNKFGRMFMKNSGKELKQNIIATAADQAKQQGYNQVEWRERLLKVDVEIHEDWWTKKNTIKKKDIINKEKILIDGIMEGLGIDDSQIWEHTLRKVDSEEFKAIVTIEQYRA